MKSWSPFRKYTPIAIGKQLMAKKSKNKKKLSCIIKTFAQERSNKNNNRQTIYANGTCRGLQKIAKSES